jgi:hypothetical protein
MPQQRPPSVSQGYSLIDNSKLEKRQTSPHTLQNVSKSSSSSKSAEVREEKEKGVKTLSANEQSSFQASNLNVILTNSGLTSSTSSHNYSKADQV